MIYYFLYRREFNIQSLSDGVQKSLYMTENTKHKFMIQETQPDFFFLLQYLNNIICPIACSFLSQKAFVKNFRNHRELLHNKPSIRKMLGLKRFPSNSLLYKKMVNCV